MDSIDIIIPTYNCEKYILKTINCALMQIGVIPHVIVINDGSTDNTDQIIKNSEFYSKITYVSQINRGVAAARNVGIMNAKSEYVCFLDSDDHYKNTFAYDLISYMKKENANVGMSDYYFVNENNKSIKLKIRKIRFSKKNVGIQLLYNNFIMTPVVIFNRAILNNLKFNESLRYNEDWVFWINLIRNEKVAFLSKPLVGIRTLNTGLTKSTKDHGKYYLEAIKNVYETQIFEDCKKKEKNQIYLKHAFNLLSFNYIVEAKNLVKNLGLERIFYRQYWKYILKLIIVKTKIIHIFRFFRVFRYR